MQNKLNHRIPENTQSNLNQIQSLKNCKIKTANNQNILQKRINQAEKEIAKLRKFANLKKGKINKICNQSADQIEKQLKGF